MVYCFICRGWLLERNWSWKRTGGLLSGSVWPGQNFALSRLLRTWCRGPCGESPAWDWQRERARLSDRHGGDKETQETELSVWSPGHLLNSEPAVQTPAEATICGLHCGPDSIVQISQKISLKLELRKEYLHLIQPTPILRSSKYNPWYENVLISFSPLFLFISKLVGHYYFKNHSQLSKGSI